MSVNEFQFYDLLRSITVTGGLILNSYRGKVENIPKTSDLPPDKVKESSTAHTVVDDLVQEVALQILMTMNPKFRINVEEDTRFKDFFLENNSEYTFHLDPLDGTLAFLKGWDSFCIGAGISKSTDFIASAVYLPARDELYYAEKNKGIIISDSNNNLKQFKRKIQPDNTYVQKRCDERLPDLKRMQLRPFKSMSAHYSMVSLAKGELQVQLYNMASVHDFGIPKVLVEEAGGFCCDQYGNDIKIDSNFSRIPYFYSFYDEKTKKLFFNS